MRAREDFETWLRKWDVGYAPRTYELLGAVLHEHAHELAEKVLALRVTVPDLKARQLFKDGYDAALMVAAFTIDPEVPSDG